MTNAVLRDKHNYFSRLLIGQNNAKDTIDGAVTQLDGVNFDTFVATGMSGAMAGMLLANAMEKNLLVVRKESDKCHDGPVFGVMGKRWLFVDDFISTGTTYQTLMGKMDSLYRDGVFDSLKDFGGNRGFDWVRPRKPVHVGAYLYINCMYHPAKALKTKYLSQPS